MQTDLLSTMFGQPETDFRLLDIRPRRITNDAGTEQIFVDIDASRIFLGIYLTAPLANPVFSLFPTPLTSAQFLIGTTGIKEMTQRTHPGFVQSRIFWSAAAGDFVDVIEVFDKSGERPASVDNSFRIRAANAMRAIAQWCK